jgi:hypothetical protein
VAIAMRKSQNSRPSSVISHTDEDLPFARPWWFHSSPLALDDPLAPFPKVALDEGTWKPFSNRDCIALEAKWNQLPDEMKRKGECAPDDDGVVDELGIQKIEKEERQEVKDASQDDTKVIVGVERLYHVDLVTQR